MSEYKPLPLEPLPLFAKYTLYRSIHHGDIADAYLRHNNKQDRTNISNFETGYNDIILNYKRTHKSDEFKTPYKYLIKIDDEKIKFRLDKLLEDNRHLLSYYDDPREQYEPVRMGEGEVNKTGGLPLDSLLPICTDCKEYRFIVKEDIRYNELKEDDIKNGIKLVNDYNTLLSNYMKSKNMINPYGKLQMTRVLVDDDKVKKQLNMLISLIRYIIKPDVVPKPGFYEYDPIRTCGKSRRRSKSIHKNKNKSKNKTKRSKSKRSKSKTKSKS